MSSVAEIVESRELIVNLTLRELRGRYKRSVLGWTWSLLNPLSTVVIYSIVFGVLLDGNPPKGDPSGAAQLHGLVAVRPAAVELLRRQLNGAMGVLTGNAGLIRKVYFPREGLVLSFVASMLVTFLIEMGVLLVILVIFGNNIWPWIPLVLVLMAVQTVFVTGLVARVVGAQRLLPRHPVSRGRHLVAGVVLPHADRVPDRPRRGEERAAVAASLHVQPDGALRRDLSAICSTTTVARR